MKFPPGPALPRSFPGLISMHGTCSCVGIPGLKMYVFVHLSLPVATNPHDQGGGLKYKRSTWNVCLCICSYGRWSVSIGLTSRYGDQFFLNTGGKRLKGQNFNCLPLTRAGFVAAIIIPVRKKENRGTRSPVLFFHMAITGRFTSMPYFHKCSM